MDLPPNLSKATLLQNTSGTANTQVVTTIVAAPGAGQRLRVWGYIFGPTASNHGATVAGRLREQSGATIAQITGPGTIGPVWIHGGFPCLTNTRIEVIDASTIVTTAIVHVVYYTLESS